MITTVDVDAIVFNDVYLPFLEDQTRTQIFYGGSASGKSVFLAQRCIYDLMQGGRNYLVCRAVGRTIRGSVFTEIVRSISEWGVGGLFSVNKSDMLITCSNGYQIIFAGLDDVEKLKSLVPARGAITDIWIEEATEAGRDTVKQLYKRQRGGSGDVSKRLVMSFNPIIQVHWIYDEHFRSVAWADDQRQYHGDDLLIVKTIYTDNRFLTDDDRRDLENETDEYYYNVYTLGNWGVLGDVIFTNWEARDLSDMRDQFTNRRIGLDFGFSSDPAALVCTHYDRKTSTIYVYDELYETGLTNPALAQRIKPMIGGDYVVADSAEPKSIQELTDLGLAMGAARKGPDSVNFGIQWLQQQRIIIDSQCINMRNELQQYQWRKDKNGVSLRQPVDRNNHLIDALRYAYESDATGSWLMS